MNAYELADLLGDLDLISGYEVVSKAQDMLRQQADRIKLLEQDGMVLIHHIAELGNEKNKLHLQKSYIAELESVLESSIRLNKAQTERAKNET